MLKYLLAGTALALIGAAQAQEALPTPSTPADSGGAVFDAAFFARFSPTNALDMVRRVPGFSLDNGEDRRGFGGARGNVLIDGEPPSSKSEDLEDLLARIPAAQVLRIELRRGAAAAGDVGAPSVLVNIVRAPSAGSGVWEAELEHADRNRISPRGNVSWTGRRGEFDFSIGARSFREYRALSGGRKIYDGAGTLVQTRQDESPRTFRLHAFNAEASRPLFGGRLAANASFEHRAFAVGVGSVALTGADARFDGRFNFAERERNDVTEAGFSYTRAFGPAALEIIGLATHDAYADDQTTLDFDNTNTLASFDALTTRNDADERVIRASLSAPLGPRHRVQAGGEAAYNKLDASNFGTSDLDGANTLVEETRGEAFLTDVWRISPSWTLEATAAYETSTLKQSPAQLETNLSFFKPSLQVTHSFGRHQARLRYYRDVDQLDFGDFVTSASLLDDNVTGGNPNLRPETSWRIEAADLRFGDVAALSLTFFHWDIDDIADVLNLENDPPGNIGSGTRDGVTVTAAFPVPYLPGARLTLDATLQNGEVTDPVTGRQRTVTELRETEVEAEFRQDFPAQQFAWGIRYFKESEFIVFRRSETDTNEEGPFLDVYAETTAIDGLKVKLTAAAIQDSTFLRQRLFFTPTRDGVATLREQRTRQFGSFLILTLSGTF